MARPPHYQRVLPAIYHPPRESTIYADISVDAGPLEAFLAAEAAAGRRATVTAAVAMAAAHALRSVPEANVVWRRGRFQPRTDVSTWVYGTDEAGSVSGVLVTHDAQGPDGNLPLDGVQSRIDVASRHRGRADGGEAYAGMARHGHRRLRAFLNALSAWTHDLGLPARRFRLGPAGFGAVGVTNVGSLGIPTAPAIPIPPFSRHVVLISVGALQDHAWVRDGVAVAGRRLPMTASLDHRAFVGLAAGRLLAAFQQALTDPALLSRLARGGRTP